MSITNENIVDIINIVKSLENSEVKTWNKKQEGVFVGAFLAPVISSVVKGFTQRGVMRAGRGWYNNMDKNFALSWKQYEVTKYFNYEPRFNSVFLR